MIFFDPGISVKSQNGIWDFTCEVPEYNQVTVPVLFEKGNCQKVYVGMESVFKYFDSPYFPVRLQCYYENGRKIFYTTGYISQKMIFLPNSTLEVIVRYLLPLIDIVPMDHNEYGNNLKSKLAMYGYNVRQGELTEIQRRNILDFVITNQFMSRIDVVNLLQHHIQYNYHWQAQNKWQRDIEYVEKKFRKF